MSRLTAQVVNWYQDGYMSATGKCFDIGNATRQSLDVWRESMRKAGNISALELRHYQNMIDRALIHEVCQLQGLVLSNLHLRREHAATAPSCVALPYHSSTTPLQYLLKSSPPWPLHPHTLILGAKKRAKSTPTLSPS